jgi:hypothetical protein
VEEQRKSAIIAVCTSILAARKLASVPRSSPAYVEAIADAVADAKRIVERIEQEIVTGRPRRMNAEISGSAMLWGVQPT